ncbi:conserved hypothetical protein [Culex quinquefasciatus]|uniref:Uncharacterized protein n=1 Tax=Culex quinquefasciatus TaxID=7176 RepID=B0X809_CULQU|nr:conserved hypothetical protein [Culex quinquefasciatus]|eukprot:XP_001865781.1 conserved hypothetical protein [Culex quinquefasciatus]
MARRRGLEDKSGFNVENWLDEGRNEISNKKLSDVIVRVKNGSGTKKVQRVQFTNLSLFGHSGKFRLYSTMQGVCCSRMSRICHEVEMTINWTMVPGLHNNGGPYRLHPKVVNRIVGVVPNQIVKTIDLKLVKYNLPGYPPLPVNLDSKKIECLKI